MVRAVLVRAAIAAATSLGAPFAAGSSRWVICMTTVMVGTGFPR
jgi:hypothetical protein